MKINIATVIAPSLLLGACSGSETEVGPQQSSQKRESVNAVAYTPDAKNKINNGRSEQQSKDKWRRYKQDIFSHISPLLEETDDYFAHFMMNRSGVGTFTPDSGSDPDLRSFKYCTIRNDKKEIIFASGEEGGETYYFIALDEKSLPTSKKDGEVQGSIVEIETPLHSEFGPEIKSIQINETYNTDSVLGTNRQAAPASYAIMGDAGKSPILFGHWSVGNGITMVELGRYDECREIIYRVHGPRAHLGRDDQSADGWWYRG
ncbi:MULTISPECIES: hypothetical protein [unclassified Novosphingobium]|uniref:hypothetical protein n=1 Tax=unclassified Novosphingobium TaxID=2644732 RepID=UPI001357EFBA|nr:MULTISPECIES: hypothetical protein [unclassified Novosphingobium]